MPFPDFFQQIPALTLYDPLAELLGAAPGGMMDYHYADAVKLAGHSCPTVAGAWLMASRGLAALHPDSPPRRGNLRVELRGQQDAGTTGVVGAVLGLITGAAGSGGFQGLAGRHSRQNLLHFGVDIPAEVRLTRLDTGAAVLLDYQPGKTPPAPELPGLMAQIANGTAEPAQRAEFARLWQERVRRILLEHPDTPGLITVQTVTAPTDPGR